MYDHDERYNKKVLRISAKRKHHVGDRKTIHVIESSV